MAAPLSIGFLVGTTYDAWKDEIQAFKDGLASYGWTEGTDFKIEFQSAAGQQNFYTTIANDFADTTRSNPIDVIVTGGTNATIACIYATNATPASSKIKVVFATAGMDGADLVKLSPSGNVTGISNEQTLHVKDRLSHMITNVPPLLARNTAFTVLGLIGNANAKNVTDEITEVVTRAKALGLTPVQSTTKLQTVADIPTVIQEVIAKKAQALYVCTDPLITSNADIVNEYALTAGLPTMHAFKKNLGGSGSNKLLYYGPELKDMFDQAADLVYNIKKGTFPAPTTPTKPPKHKP